MITGSLRGGLIFPASGGEGSRCSAPWINAIGSGAAISVRSRFGFFAIAMHHPFDIASMSAPGSPAAVMAWGGLRLLCCQTRPQLQQRFRRWLWDLDA